MRKTEEYLLFGKKLLVEARAKKTSSVQIKKKKNGKALNRYDEAENLNQIDFTIEKRLKDLSGASSEKKIELNTKS